MRFFRNLFKTWKEESPRFSQRQMVEALKLYGDIRGVYQIFEEQKRGDRIHNLDAVNIILNNIRVYELNVPADIRERVDIGQGSLSVTAMKYQLEQARR